MRFDFNSPKPIYLQVAEQIKEAIFIGDFPENEKIPSTTEISKHFHINPATVLKGMNILVNEGLLEKHRGMGTYVTDYAQFKIKTEQKNNFYDHYIKKLVKEALQLDISLEEIQQLIQRGYEKYGNRS